MLDDYRTAPIGERMRTTLAFLEKLTPTPGDVGLEDVAPMLAAGASHEAVEEAIYVATLFNFIDRLADVFKVVREAKRMSTRGTARAARGRADQPRWRSRGHR